LEVRYFTHVYKSSVQKGIQKVQHLDKDI